ncbi:MAG: tyrosine-type recombinase/integrase [Rhodocyclales bacterium]|nr:tyrosine-type recombinase/integrase [Rhodocyclales bacterium]
MPLTDTQIRKTKPGDKPVKMTDGNGLYLLLSPAGGKLWRLDYRFGGKRKTLALGAYPSVPLAKARADAGKAREKIAAGDDPGAERKRMKVALADTFKAAGEAWYKTNAESREPATRGKWRYFLDIAYAEIGAQPVRAIAAADLVRMVRKINDKGLAETARRTFAMCGRVFRYAVAHGLADRDPSRDVSLRDVLPAQVVEHHASLTDPAAVGGLLRAIDGYEGSAVTRHALRLAALVFVRPGELRHAEWSEFDTDRAEWRIPAAKMKMGEKHVVPLSAQAMAVLDDLRPLTGDGSYLFPSERTRDRPMSENTVNAALRRLGYTTDEMCGHGFRSTASTLLHEMGYQHAVIERQLAHAERNKVAAAYNFAEYLPERRKMMSEWADYLDQLRAGAKVIPIKTAA